LWQAYETPGLAGLGYCQGFAIAELMKNNAGPYIKKITLLSVAIDSYGVDGA
jgi:hypothetical protein